MIVDENNGYVALAWDGTDAASLRVDPSTGRLLIVIVDSNPAAGSLSTAKIDENNESSSLAVDDNGVIRPLLTDTNGYLLADLIIE